MTPHVAGVRRLGRRQAGAGGGVLGRPALERRIRAGELFTGTDPMNYLVDDASVDIRIDRSRLRLPPPEDSAETSRYIFKDGREYPESAFTLAPGEVAFVTSHERFRLASDLVGNIGVRFGFAGKGLLVHTGLLIHPGFGQTDPDGEALHFIIVNLSPQQKSIAFSEPIATVQLMHLDPPAPRPTKSNRRDLEDRYLVDGDDLGLSFLTDIGTLRESIGDTDARLAGVVRDMDARLAEVRRDVDTTRQAGQQLILFGVYVLASALIGVALTFYLSLAHDGSLKGVVDAYADVHFSWTSTIALVAVLGFIAYMVHRSSWGAVTAGVKRVLHSLDVRRQRKEAASKPEPTGPQPGP